MFDKSHIVYIVIFVLCLMTGFFGFMWSKTSQELDIKSAKLIQANATIEALQNDNNRLNEYNNKKNKEIQEIEDKYKEKLNNIPTDSCGDVKPSKKLMEYFRKNA